MAHFRVVIPGEEDVPCSLVFVGGVSELDNDLLGGGRLGTSILGSLAVEKVGLKVGFHDGVDVHISDRVDWLCLFLFGLTRALLPQWMC